MGLRMICQTVANCRQTFPWYRKVLTCIANSSGTVRQSFKHVILFCATKIIAKPSLSHRRCREPVADLSPTLRRRSQTHRKEVSAICTMQQICNIRSFRDLIARNKTDQNSHERRETFTQMSHDCRVTQSHECLTPVLRQSRESLRTVVRVSSI